MIKSRWLLNEETKNILEKLTPKFGFNGFGEATYYRTYSRLKENGSQEHWADTVIRVMQGIMSTRKDHYDKNLLPWDEKEMQALANKMAISMFEMKWLPPGRGLWAMGTNFVYKNGASALNNCGAVDVADLAIAADWAMDMLMCGVGVGYNTDWKGDAKIPNPKKIETFIIPDSREGWVMSVKMLIQSYTDNENTIEFDYSKIRPAGAIIKGFGGTSSGYKPLETLHLRIRKYMSDYCNGIHGKTRTVSDVMNAVGACVVAGNVRRSALINLGSPDDAEFLDLKDYEKNPERADIGWMSNNTAILKDTEDFEYLPAIADRIRKNGEPGIMNLVNVQKYGRYGKESSDKAWLANPCSEIPLESFELCNLAEVFPTNCENEEEFYEVLKYATFYTSTVSLLPTHRPETNAVVFRNRRIGVSLSGVADLLDDIGSTQMTKRLRKGYKIVKDENEKLASEAGIPPAIRITTVKPSGTISQLAGVSSGMHFPTFKHAIRRIRVGQNTPIHDVLINTDIPNEPDKYSKGTTIFEFPIDQGKTRKATEVSAWEQFALLAMLQREWSDNMVSCSIYFNKETEADQIEQMLAQFAPIIKSVSMLPHSEDGAYEQMPYEGITKEKYEELLAKMPRIDWKKFGNSDGMEEQFCSNGNCEIS